MTYKDMVALIVWITVMFALMGIFVVAYEHFKCDHIEIGPVTHNLSVD